MSRRNGEGGTRFCPQTGLPILRGGRRRWVSWLFPVSGLLALVWFLVRVVPKPSRAMYPCQRAAMPIACGFVAWVVGLLGSIAAVRRAKVLANRSRVAAAGLFVGLAAMILWATLATDSRRAAGALDPIDGPNNPFGTPQGIHPGRVVWVHRPEVAKWDGSTGRWWYDANTDPIIAAQMLSDSIRWLTGQNNDIAAWDAIFRDFNDKHGKGAAVYQPGEKIAIKLNLNQCNNHGDGGNASFNSPQLVKALLRQLVDNVGAAPADVMVYDASRQIPSSIYSPCSVGDLAAVRFVDTAGGDGRIKAAYDPAAVIRHADSYVAPHYLPTCVVEADYLINFAILRGHDHAGMTACAKNHFGSIWSPVRNGFKPSYEIHHRINAFERLNAGSFSCPARPMGSYNPLVELMGHRDLGAKTLLFLIDGLYAVDGQGSAVTLGSRWVSLPFNGRWTASLFASQDGVAIDSVALDFLRNEPSLDSRVRGTVEDYLHEAALADDPVSGTVYDPEGDGMPLASLGVHEHCNNAAQRRYTGGGVGVDLVSSEPVEPLVGDLEPDGDVDWADLELMLANWLTPVAPRTGGDLDGDGFVDLTDLGLLAGNFGRSQGR